MGKRRGPTHLLSNWASLSTAVYSTVPVPLLRVARPVGWVNCFRICASKMQRAQKRTATGSFLKENEILCLSRNMIYLWFTLSNFFKGQEFFKSQICIFFFVWFPLSQLILDNCRFKYIILLTFSQALCDLIYSAYLAFSWESWAPHRTYSPTPPGIKKIPDVMCTSARVHQQCYVVQKYC